MRDAENGAARLVAETFDFPAVRENNLLHHGQAEAGAFLMRREIRLENFPLVFGRDAGAVVADFQRAFRRARALGDKLDLAAAVRRLDGVEQQIEEDLPQQLFVGLDRQRFAAVLDALFFFAQVKIHGAHNFVDGAGEV